MVKSNREEEAQAIAQEVANLFRPSSNEHNIEIEPIHSPFVQISNEPRVIGYEIRELGPKRKALQRNIFYPHQIESSQLRPTTTLAVVYLDPSDHRIRVWDYTFGPNADKIESLSEVSEEEDMASVAQTPRGRRPYDSFEPDWFSKMSSFNKS